MRLLIDIQGAQNDSRFRGIGRYLNALLSHLIYAKAADDEILLLLNGQLAEGLGDIRSAYAHLIKPENFKIWYPIVPSSWGNPRNKARRVASEVIREWVVSKLKPDCILIGSLFEGCGDNVIATIPAGKHIPTAVIFYDLIPYIYPDLYLGSEMLRGWYQDKLDNLKRADLLLAISEASKQEAIGLLEFPSNRVCNISSGIDLNLFGHSSLPFGPLGQKFGIEGRYLLYTGAADPRKNLDTLLKAFASLPAEVIADVSLVLVGQMTEGQQRALKLLAKAFPKGVRQLIFTGHVSDGELLALYRNALAFVFPSFHEGFGLPLLEAMAAGCPVISSNCSACPEVVAVPEAMFDPHSISSMAQLLRKVILDQDYRTLLVRLQGERVSLFSWSGVAAQAWASIRQLVDRQVIDSAQGPSDAMLVSQVAEALHRSGGNISDFALAAESIQKAVVMSK